jgi:hypothetical protein
VLGKKEYKKKNLKFYLTYLYCLNTTKPPCELEVSLLNSSCLCLINFGSLFHLILV